jgi:hypothetical protein
MRSTLPTQLASQYHEWTSGYGRRDQHHWKTTSLRVGNGTGVYALGAARQIEWGLRPTFSKIPVVSATGVCWAGGFFCVVYRRYHGFRSLRIPHNRCFPASCFF